MKAVILAAGMASRLRPLTNNCPKCLLSIGTRPLLERIIIALIAADINELVIVTGYLHEQIEEFVKSKFTDLNVTFIYNKRYNQTNNIYSLWLTRQYTQGADTLLLDSDILFDPMLLTDILGVEGEDVSCLAVNRHELGDEEIKVILDSKGKVQEISKVCDIDSAMGESVGIERMSAKYTDALFCEMETMILKEKLDNVFYEKAFERLIPQGHTFSVVDTTKYFSIELDTVEDFNAARKLIPESLY